MSTYLRRDDWVTDAMGNALSGASVYVCTQPATTTSIPPSPLAQLYSDPAGADPITQPVVTDGYGHAFYYAAPGTYTIVYYSPQIEQVNLADQNIGSGNVAFPITIAEGGTNATTAPQALINLGAAASGANSDITSLSAIPGTSISTTGYLYGSGTFATGGPLAQIADQNWAGTGYTGFGFGTCNGSAYSLVSSNGFETDGLVSAETLRALNNVQVYSPGIIQCDNYQPYTPGNPITFSPSGVTGAGSVGVEIFGNSTLGQALLGFSTYPTQATVGAAGGAAALPATPTGYLPVSIGGVEYVIPYYAKS